MVTLSFARLRFLFDWSSSGLLAAGCFCSVWGFKLSFDTDHPGTANMMPNFLSSVLSGLCARELLSVLQVPTVSSFAILAHGRRKIRAVGKAVVYCRTSEMVVDRNASTSRDDEENESESVWGDVSGCVFGRRDRWESCGLSGFVRGCGLGDLGHRDITLYMTWIFRIDSGSSCAEYVAFQRLFTCDSN